MKIHFVLCNPAVAENIGLALRALKVMGFEQMRLVNPVDGFRESAKKTAYGAHDLLDQALVFPSLKEALVGMDLVIGTTAKRRQSRHDYHSPAKINEILISKEAVIENAAIVFGSEQSGLSSEELDQCDLLSSLPMAVKHPSFNLSQSVLIYAYELSRISKSGNIVPKDASPIKIDQQALKHAAMELLDLLEVSRQPSLYNRLKDRIMTASSEDTELMLALAKFVKQRLKQQKS